jgi:hypothetical protein
MPYLRLLLIVGACSVGLFTSGCSTRSSGLDPKDSGGVSNGDDADPGPSQPDRPPIRFDTSNADMPMAPADGGDASTGDGPRSETVADGVRLDGPDGSTADGGDARPSDSRPPDGPRDMAVDRITNVPPGGACTATTQCRAGLFCAKPRGAAADVPGVCCNEMCNNGCEACTMAKTGRPDGTCAPDRDLDRKACGRVCYQQFMGTPSVVEKICINGECTLPAPPAPPKVIETCYKDDNPCARSFCDNSDPNNPVCRHPECPTAGNCCCSAPGGAKMCVPMGMCTAPRTCLPRTQ